MRFDPRQLVRRYRASAIDIFSSQYQFELTYGSVSALLSSGRSNERQAALWLSSFLAHWGMFRASSQLRHKNTLFFEALVRFSVSGKRAALKPLMSISFEELSTLHEEQLDESFCRLYDWLAEHDVTGTDTLLSKIALALLGNVPAYDRNFKRGLQLLAFERKYRGVQKFCGRGLRDLSKWASSRKWPRVLWGSDGRRYLPRARVIDMAIFQFGAENSR